MEGADFRMLPVVEHLQGWHYIATPTVQGTSSSRTNICFKIVIKS